MSRGLYQLSYGSNRRNMPPFPPFGKKKKTFRREFPERRSSGAFLPRACRAFRLCGLSPSFRRCAEAPLTPKRILCPQGARTVHSPTPATAHSLKESLAAARCLIGASTRALPAGPKRLQRTGRPATDRSAFHKRPGTRTASDQPRLFSCQAPCSCAVPDQTHLVLRNTRKKRYSGQPPVCLQVPPSGLFLTALPPRQSTAKRPSLPKERGPCSPHGRKGSEDPPAVCGKAPRK